MTREEQRSREETVLRSTTAEFHEPVDRLKVTFGQGRSG